MEEHRRIRKGAVTLHFVLVTDLGGRERGGQAMGLNVFLLFNGFGLGAFAFGELLRVDFATALAIFAAGEAVLAMLAVRLFRAETPERTEAGSIG